MKNQLSVVGWALGWFPKKLIAKGREARIQEFAMQSKTAQWILWAITMAIFAALSLTRHFDALLVAIMISSVVWYVVVPRTASR